MSTDREIGGEIKTQNSLFPCSCCSYCNQVNTVPLLSNTFIRTNCDLIFAAETLATPLPWHLHRTSQLKSGPRPVECRPSRSSVRGGAICFMDRPFIHPDSCCSSQSCSGNVLVDRIARLTDSLSKGFESQREEVRRLREDAKLQQDAVNVRLQRLEDQLRAVLFPVQHTGLATSRSGPVESSAGK
jgi:hypothetical protein